MSISQTFGCRVFNDTVMCKRLSRDVYTALQQTISEGRTLDASLAAPIAAAMKDWAIENGCTHFTHWFQPLTGITAEKHESFLSLSSEGHVMMEFSAKELIRGESDASSFPSGGLRETFEARGYTAWDPTSYAFIKDNTLCIPTVFCSFSGESLDKKTPLLRSMDAIDREARRVLSALGDHTTRRVTPCVGAEQEYFLIPHNLYEQREDLLFTGRTLFGAKPSKGQSLEYHYSGSIAPAVKAFMSDLDKELWKLGVFAKTEHNEAAPSQHELAPIYSSANTATDQNQLIMELMKKTAEKHGFTCLLHEKPFAYINGSGKHNNWSLCTDQGRNLFAPSGEPENDRHFLLFIAAVIKAVDEYQDLLRASTASISNDCRLGANEAPTAILSLYLGSALEEIFETRLAHGTYGKKKKDYMQTGVNAVPLFAKDTEDRNRTSPIAFTGNKFEFRMPGASQSIAGPNVMLNTVVAEELAGFADVLEQAEDMDAATDRLINDTYRAHRRIVFNGNNYSEEWVTEAGKRGLPNLRTTPDALPALVAEKNVRLFEKHRIYTRAELQSRCEISLMTYQKSVGIEARTMVDMAQRQILPAVMRYARELADTAAAKHLALSLLRTPVPEEKILRNLCTLQQTLYNETESLKDKLDRRKCSTQQEKADYARDVLLPAMAKVRSAADALEQITDASLWPIPSYTQLLFH